MKISHEAPISIFNKVQELTDYDYALVHLFEESEEYLENFRESKKRSREIILDNSIFELGEAFNGEKFANWVEKLKPTYYIVPDVLEDSEKTIESYLKFTSEFKKLPGKKIGVVQGKTYEELVSCYRRIINIGVDKIAISFDYSYYESQYVDTPKLESWMKGRQAFISRLSAEKFFSRKHPIHLLGCSLPQEFQYYRTNKLIDSVDTSNPVVHGLKDISYESYGLKSKESQKLFTLINSKVSKKQWELIESNIKQFKQFCNG